jgi:hypothetical protein
MKVLSHRGLWTSVAEKNSSRAFARSFQAGWGTETDVRDMAGRLVISHDMPSGNEISLDEFLLLQSGLNLPLAMNIKADGLAEPVRAAMQRHQVRDWFVFDMSVPDMRAHLRAGNPVMSRLSEVERTPVWLDQCCGVWLDGFESAWFGVADIEDLLRAGKRVCAVSPELHGRDPAAVWQMLRPLAHQAGLMLCTDRPQEASVVLGLGSGSGQPRVAAAERADTPLSIS